MPINSKDQFSTQGHRSSSSLTPLSIALIYAAIGSLWILLSDILLSQISFNTGVFASLSILKGWLYVAITSLLLYWLINRYAAARQMAEDSLRESETRFRTIFDSVNDAIFLHDPVTGVIQDVNQRMCELYGYTYEEALKLDVGAISAGGPDFNQKEAVRKIRACGTDGPQLFEWLCKKHNGELFWTEVNMKPALIERQQRILVTVRDISERKKAAEVELDREKAEAASYAKSEFLTHIGHELRTPLNSIIGFSEFLMDDCTHSLSASQLEYIKYINESGLHLLHLTNDIRDLSKIEAGKLELKIERIPVVAIIKESLDLICAATEKSGIRIVTETNSAPETIMADKLRLKQVLLNLLNNAVRHTNDGGMITIRVTSKESATEFSIADTGAGISPKNQEKLFMPFSQIDQENRGGSGLGLSICKNIVELHGGRIRVESSVGKGSTFIFSIPSNIPVEVSNER